MQHNADFRLEDKSPRFCYNVSESIAILGTNLGRTRLNNSSLRPTFPPLPKAKVLMLEREIEGMDFARITSKRVLMLRVTLRL